MADKKPTSPHAATSRSCPTRPPARSWSRRSAGSRPAAPPSRSRSRSGSAASSSPRSASSGSTASASGSTRPSRPMTGRTLDRHRSSPHARSVTTAPDPPLVDATAMTRFHRIFREALDAVPRFIGGVPDGDAARADLVGSYYANVLKLLHAHHEAEDLTIYPLMVERLPDHLDVISPRTRAGVPPSAVAGAPRGRAAAARRRTLPVLLAHDHRRHARPSRWTRDRRTAAHLIATAHHSARAGAGSPTAFQHFSGDRAGISA